MIRRIWGGIVLVIALAGLFISVWLYSYGRGVLNTAFGQASDLLDVAAATLTTTEESLLLTQASLESVGDTLQTVETTMADLSATISQTQPLVQQVDTVVTESFPDSLEAIETTIPNIAGVAGTVDDTLTVLSAFRIEQDLDFEIVDLGTLDFDLGIDYDPEVRFDESISQLGESLEGLPAQLRALDVYLGVASDNLAVISRDLGQLSRDVAAVNESVSATPALLDAYLQSVTTVQERLQQTQTQVESQARTSRLALALVAIWLGLSQLAPLYVGIEMVWGPGALEEALKRVRQNG